jgi:hypothetical protein
MARQKEYKKIDIDVEPFLSIMAIVLKLISLVLVVIVMRIAVNPKGKRIISLMGLYEGHGNQENPKSPAYIDCAPDGITLYPGSTLVTWEQLQKPDNAVDQLLDKIQADSSNEYVVVMVRPKSVKYYRTVRSMISKRPIDVGYDAVDEDFKVNWDAAQKALAVSTD